MAKFMVLYCADISPSELMAQSSPEEMKASMDEWIKWADGVRKTNKFEFGLPLQPVNKVTPEGVAKSDSQVSGYSTIEADSKEAINELLKNHPHLKHPGATIEVLEMLPMPGM